MHLISSTSKKTIPYILVIFISTLFFSSCDSSKKSTTSSAPADTSSTSDENKPTRITFNTNADLSAALEKAKIENKVVFLDFYTTWCYPCKMMDQGAFRDWDVADYMTSNCVALKVDAEKDNGLALSSQFGVGAYPTLVFLSPDGKELARKEGSLGIEDFKVFMKSSVWKYKGQ